jgi:hypothetical protein
MKVIIWLSNFDDAKLTFLWLVDQTDEITIDELSGPY